MLYLQNEACGVAIPVATFHGDEQARATIKWLRDLGALLGLEGEQRNG